MLIQDEVKKRPWEEASPKEEDIGFLESGDGVCEEEPGCQRGEKGRRHQAGCRQLPIPGRGNPRREPTSSGDTYQRGICHIKVA